MARDPIAYDLYPLRVNVGTGSSTFVGVTAIAGQEFVYLQHLSGGTCEITNPNMGIGPGAGLPVPTSPLKIDMAGLFYMTASGSTAIIGVMRGRAAGFEGATTV